MRNALALLTVLFLLFSCEDNDETVPETPCGAVTLAQELGNRNFRMGFSSWPYGPDPEDVEETYAFIQQYADLYSEHIDDRIPWAAWINDTELPEEFTGNIGFRASNRVPGHELLVAVSLLNNERDDLHKDYDGTIPAYTALNDALIEDAYFKHLVYIVSELDPDYLVFAMEVNDLKIKSEQRWSEYRLLSENLYARLKARYPDLPMAQSVTLHNYFQPEVANPDTFIEEVSDFVNTQNDFAAISFYPFFKGLDTAAEFQQAFDFLHDKIAIPIAFVETNHIAEDLVNSALGLNIPGDPCGQRVYLEVLLRNAHDMEYAFLIWWAHRDYDELWETFPAQVRDVGQIWRDTGLLDEEGADRPAYEVWELVLGI